MGVVEEESDLRTGLALITHGFGRNPGDNIEPRCDGDKVNLPLRSDEDFEPYSAMPEMAALPIAVRPAR